MTDRALLELAAKAAGIGDWVWDEQFLCMKPPPHAYSLAHTQKHWNPLTDDGDAMRLAVKLLFEIDMGLGCIAIRHSTGIKILEAFNNDPYAATRRAIVRAAAEIGKEMK